MANKQLPYVIRTVYNNGFQATRTKLESSTRVDAGIVFDRVAAKAQHSHPHVGRLELKRGAKVLEVMDLDAQRRL